MPFQGSKAHLVLSVSDNCPLQLSIDIANWHLQYQLTYQLVLQMLSLQIFLLDVL